MISVMYILHWEIAVSSLKDAVSVFFLFNHLEHKYYIVRLFDAHHAPFFCRNHLLYRNKVTSKAL